MTAPDAVPAATTVEQPADALRVHASPLLERAQHDDVYRLQVGLRRLATAELTPVAGAPRPLADRLTGVVEALEQLTDLARRLHEQARQQARLEGGGR